MAAPPCSALSKPLKPKHLEVYAWSFVVKHLHLFHCKIYIELSKKRKDSIESKVDVKLPFAMLLMTPYIIDLTNYGPKKVHK
jgi:hypothetical protein